MQPAKALLILQLLRFVLLAMLTDTIMLLAVFKTKRRRLEFDADNWKRKRVGNQEEMVAVISSRWGNAIEAIRKVAEALRTKPHAATANRKRLYETIKNLPLTLTRADRVRATSILARQEDQMDIFFEFPEEEKCDMVHLALENALQ